MALFVGKFRCHESSYQVEGQFLADDALSKAKDIHVVVFHALVGGVVVVAKPGANSVHLVRRHRSPHPTPTDQDASFAALIQHSCSKLDRAVRIMIRHIAVVRAEIDDLVAELLQFGDHDFVQGDPGVVGGNSNSHRAYFFSAFAEPALFIDSFACFTTFSTVKPKCFNKFLIGAEAPKSERAMMAPSIPTYSRQPRSVPASTATRARTLGGKTKFRY